MEIQCDACSKWEPLDEARHYCHECYVATTAGVVDFRPRSLTLELMSIEIVVSERQMVSDLYKAVAKHCKIPSANVFTLVCKRAGDEDDIVLRPHISTGFRPTRYFRIGDYALENGDRLFIEYNSHE